MKKNTRLWMNLVVTLITYHLSLITSSAQTIQNQSKWWDGGVLYTATVNGNAVTMDGVAVDAVGFQFHLTRLANRQGEYVLSGSEAEAENLRAKVGWRVQYIRKEGMYFLAIRNPQGDAVWKLTLTPDNLQNCMGQQAFAEEQSPSELLSGWLMDTYYLGKFSKADLRLMRNEILARHGYRFQSKDLQDYFGSKDWYMPGYNNAAIKLSVIEELNLQLIKSEEKVPEQRRLKSMSSEAPTEGAPIGDNYPKEEERVVVTNARDFILSLGSNKEIIIPENTQINLSNALDDEKLFSTHRGMDWVKMYEFEDKVNTSGKSLIVSQSVHDGRQLGISGVENLTIKGHRNASIIVEPRYAFVLGFYDCRNIKIENLTIGHTEEGYCQGGVIGLYRTTSTRILNCDLYGCGTYGIVATNSRNIEMEKSIIRDCSYGIMELEQTPNAHFTNCCFFRNREYTLIETRGNCNGMSFRNCNFWQNRGPLFSLSSMTEVENCAIFHKYDYGTTEMLKSVGDEPGYYGGPKDDEMNVPDGVGPE